MAEEKKTPEKVEEGKLTKVLNWFKKLPVRIAKPFKNMVAELKKVTWPSRKKLIASSITVLLFMLFMGVVIGLLDLGATSAVKGLVNAIPTATPVATAVPEVTEVPAEVVEATDVPAETEVPAATEAPAAE